jgi:hypothetical protein
MMKEEVEWLGIQCVKNWHEASLFWKLLYDLLEFG